MSELGKQIGVGDKPLEEFVVFNLICSKCLQSHVINSELSEIVTKGPESFHRAGLAMVIVNGRQADMSQVTQTKILCIHLKIFAMDRVYHILPFQQPTKIVALTLTLLYHISTYVVIFLTGSVLYHIGTYVVFCDWCGMISGTLFINLSAPQLFFSFLFYEKYLK